LLNKLIYGILFIVLPIIIFAQNDSSLQKNSWSNSHEIKSFIAPAILTTAGLLTYKESGFLNKVDLQQFLHDNIGLTHTHIDDYLQFVPILAVYGLDVAGVKAKNDFYNRSALLMKSEILTLCIAYGLKHTVDELRPDGSNSLSFPSGHTAQAFMSATLMHKEFRDKSIWYSVAGYSTATAVGLLRILNNRHWTNDVLFGAATGIFSVNLVYLTHKHVNYKYKKSTSFLFPFSDGKYSGLGLVWQL
jgi:membrane-associated phospholipid phosphatase